MALILHSHPLASFCWKVLIALYEKGTPFEARLIDLGDPQAREAYAALWPTAKIPLLQDGDHFVPETSIQIEHLDRRYPGKVRLLPDDPEAQLEVRLWDRVFDNYVQVPMQTFVAQQLRPEAMRDQPTIDQSLAGLGTAYDLIDSRLGGRTWAAGEAFSMADCAAAPGLFYASIVRPFPPGHRVLGGYFERLMARPSVKRVIAEARPYFHFFPLHEAIPSRFLAEEAHAD